MKLFGQKILYEKRGEAATVQVLQRGDKRELRFGNHIIQSAMSQVAPDFLLLEYTRAMMAACLFATPEGRLLHLGLGGGSLPRFIHGHFPQVLQQVVELQPEVIEVAYRFFDLPVSPRLQVTAGDGERFLETSRERYQMIFQDAYHATGVDQHLKSGSFFRTLHAHLEPGGWLINNVWGSDKENLNLVTLNLAAVFPQLYSLSVGADSNVIFFAGATSLTPSQESMLDRAAALARELPLELEGMAKKITRVRTGPHHAVRKYG